MWTNYVKQWRRYLPVLILMTVLSAGSCSVLKRTPRQAKTSSLSTTTQSDSTTIQRRTRQRTEADSLEEYRHRELSTLLGWRILNQECDIFLYDTEVPDHPVYAYIHYRANGADIRHEERTNEDSGRFKRCSISDYAQWEDSVARSTRRASELNKETISQVSCNVVRPVVLFASLILLALCAIRMRVKS